MEEDNQTIPDNKFLKKKHLWMTLSVLFVIIALALVFVAYKVISGYIEKSKGLQVNQTQNNTQNKENVTRRAIDGVYVEKGKENLYPLAVMMDNHPDARPISALAQANLVIEAEAEGRITRFLAIFASSDVLGEIGPVRSARP